MICRIVAEVSLSDVLLTVKLLCLTCLCRLGFAPFRCAG
jgi:hypothetical protein